MNLKNLYFTLRRLFNRLLIIDVMLSIKLLFNDDFLLCYWFEHPDKNFGDDLNPWMLERMTGKRIINSRRIINFKRVTELSFIGSILGKYTRRKMLVLGSGLISQDKLVQYSKDSRFSFVRGPLTQEILVKNGYICPEIYGDPALILPLIYVPNDIQKKYKLGVIPHYVDKDHPFIDVLRNYDKCKIIDIQGGVEKTINDINSCDLIVSSSLHGIIVADTYEIPSRWIEFSNKVVGNGFKFRDYFLSVGRKKMNPYVINSFSNYSQLIELFEIDDIPIINYDSMLKQLPPYFKIHNRRS